MAEVDLSLAVARQVEEMRKAGGYPSDEALDQLARQIGRAFNVRKQEVAILRVSADRKTLSFVYPTRLARVGAIPLTTTHSLATKTIRDKRGEIVNNFPVYKHPTVFEAVKLSEEEKATPIKKIISSPMIVDGKVEGVIQVSRKAATGETVGADFKSRDLAELANVGTILGKYVVTLPAPKPAPAEPAKPAKS
jgi:hypothetical protein